MPKPRYEIRPLGAWIGPVTPDRRSSSTFRAPWLATLHDLEYEAGLLGAQLVVIQVDAEPSKIRRDGMLYANAVVGFPGVRISLDSLYGPLTYATDRYDGWQANVRAIVLGLEALRAVDRYGITRTGEQYRGFTAITTGAAPMSRQQAADLLAHDLDGVEPEHLIDNPGAAGRAFLKLAQTHHPDRRGDRDLFERLTAARDLLTRST